MMSFHSTRSTDSTVTAKQAIRQGIAPDGGLFVTDALAALQVNPASLAGQTYQETAVRILGLLLDDYSAEELDLCVRAAYGAQWSDTDITPLVRVGDDYVLELFNGPTSAFKDVALQLLPRLMSRTLPQADETERIMILTATSGDTGKAALAGFAGAPGTAITVFYPEGKVSQVQRLQMVTQAGSNVRVCAVRGNFDDAQAAVKAVFADRDLAGRLRDQAGTVLSSANSINVGRLVPQVVYYFRAYGSLIDLGAIKAGDPVEFCVPTGNFGDVLAGYYASMMGLPVARLTVASDRNKVLTDFLSTGVYDRNRPFYTTTSPSMDILISSNLERMLYYMSGGDTQLISSLMEDLFTQGRYQVPAGLLKRIRSLFACGWADEDQVSAAIRECWQENRYLIDPHTACGYRVMGQAPRLGGVPRVLLSTASPYKFPRVVGRALGLETPTSDFSCMDALSAATGTLPPPGLRGLEGAGIRFDDCIDVDDMPAYVYRTALCMKP
ncbi:threonine synthase [Bifidobacterium favimelis]|uniref:Threonine synthase n=1 Tax=Bifidobacterium favimelis TaxID=3122979 RepID=A0ABU8ZND7_9BIFI